MTKDPLERARFLGVLTAKQAAQNLNLRVNSRQSARQKRETERQEEKEQAAYERRMRAANYAYHQKFPDRQDVLANAYARLTKRSD